MIPLHFWVSIPVSIKGLTFSKSRSRSWLQDWHFQSLNLDLEKGIGILKVSISISIYKFRSRSSLKTQAGLKVLISSTHFTVELKLQLEWRQKKNRDIKDKNMLQKILLILLKHILIQVLPWSQLHSLCGAHYPLKTLFFLNIILQRFFVIVHLWYEPRWWAAAIFIFIYILYI